MCLYTHICNCTNFGWCSLWMWKDMWGFFLVSSARHKRIPTILREKSNKCLKLLPVLSVRLMVIQRQWWWWPDKAALSHKPFVNYWQNNTTTFDLLTKKYAAENTVGLKDTVSIHKLIFVVVPFLKNRHLKKRTFDTMALRLVRILKSVFRATSWEQPGCPSHSEMPFLVLIITIIFFGSCFAYQATGCEERIETSIVMMRDYSNFSNTSKDGSLAPFRQQ